MKEKKKRRNDYLGSMRFKSNSHARSRMAYCPPVRRSTRCAKAKEQHQDLEHMIAQNWRESYSWQAGYTVCTFLQWGTTAVSEFVLNSQRELTTVHWEFLPAGQASTTTRVTRFASTREACPTTPSTITLPSIIRTKTICCNLRIAISEWNESHGENKGRKEVKCLEHLPQPSKMLTERQSV